MTSGTPPTSTATRVNDGFADAAATPPSPAVNSRRRIRHLLSPHCAQPIAAGNLGAIGGEADALMPRAK
jgi:hypothetical protein